MTNNDFSIVTDPESGRKLRVYPDGFTTDAETGRIVRAAKSRYITPERSREFHEQKRAMGIVAQMKGLSKAAGVTLPEDADLLEIAKGASSAIEALTEHMARTFTGSSNLRGMAEGYGKLIAPLVGEERDAKGAPSVFINNMNIAPGYADAMIRVLKDIMAKQDELGIVDGEVTPKGETD